MSGILFTAGPSFIWRILAFLALEYSGGDCWGCAAQKLALRTKHIGIEKADFFHKKLVKLHHLHWPFSQKTSSNPASNCRVWKCLKLSKTAQNKSCVCFRNQLILRFCSALYYFSCHSAETTDCVPNALVFCITFHWPRCSASYEGLCTRIRFKRPFAYDLALNYCLLRQFNVNKEKWKSAVLFWTISEFVENLLWTVNDIIVPISKWVILINLQW